MYLNTFINLEENINGYGQNQKSPSGHVIICMPGMVRVYLQNLRNLQDKEYICYGLSKKDNKAIRLGSINAPDENKMTNFKIDINNIQGKGVRADNIDCIAIVIEGDTVGNTDTVMVGYVSDKYLITPILEKGLPKKEIKPVQEERKDSTPSSNKSKVEAKETQALNTNVITPIQTEGPTPKTQAEIEEEVATNQEALNTDVITPIQTEGPTPKTQAEIEEEVATNQEALNTDVITPIQTEGPTLKTQAEIEEEVVANQEALNTDVITPIQTETYEEDKSNQPVAMGSGPVELPTPGVTPGQGKPNQPADPGSGPVALPTPELNSEVGKPNQPIAPGPVILPKPELGKNPCACGKDKKKGDKDLGKQIKDIIEALGRKDTQVDNIEENVEHKLKELMAQGISREELLNRKGELEEQIKGLLGNKIVNKHEKDSTRNPMEEPSEEAVDLEDKFRAALNKQFDIELDRGCKACQSPVEVIMDKDESFYEVNLEPEKQSISDGCTSKEEVDFLEQLEIKLKGLQQLLKTTISGEGAKNSLKEFSKSNEVGLAKEDNIQANKQKREKKNKITREEANYLNEKEEEEDSKKTGYERVREIFETSVSIRPFENDSQPVDWVRISLAELISIPQLQYEWATQPFITFSYHKFNHLILGKDREVEQYYIGIPDVYHQTRGHILDIDKIERFVCRNADKLATGEPGYWIAMI